MKLGAALGVAGTLVVVGGVWWIYPPAGLIVLGVWLLAAGVAYGRLSEK